jgi:low affinity Fe/Cu permease
VSLACRRSHDRSGTFARFTGSVSRISGSSKATIVAAAAILAWLVSGPLFHDEQLIAVTRGASDRAIGIERANEERDRPDA